MANPDIVERLRDTLAQQEAGACSLGDLVLILEFNVEALEGLPFTLYKRFKQVEHDLLQAHWAEEEGLVSEPAPVIEELRSRLSEVIR